MIRYEVLKDKPKQLLSLTGFTSEEFSALLPSFSKRFFGFVETKTLDSKDRKKRQYTLYKNSCFPSIEDMLLFLYFDVPAKSDDARCSGCGLLINVLRTSGFICFC